MLLGLNSLSVFFCVEYGVLFCMGGKKEEVGINGEYTKLRNLTLKTRVHIQCLAPQVTFDIFNTYHDLSLTLTKGLNITINMTKSVQTRWKLGLSDWTNIG